MLVIQKKAMRHYRIMRELESLKDEVTLLSIKYMRLKRKYGKDVDFVCMSYQQLIVVFL